MLFQRLNFLCDDVQLFYKVSKAGHLVLSSVFIKIVLLLCRDGVQSSTENDYKKFSMDLVSGSVSQPLEKYLKVSETSAHLLPYILV